MTSPKLGTRKLGTLVENRKAKVSNELLKPQGGKRIAIAQRTIVITRTVRLVIGPPFNSGNETISLLLSTKVQPANPSQKDA